MPQTLSVAPWKQVLLENGFQAPFYIIPFSKKGTVMGPRTYDHLLKEIATGDWTDIYVFSHGWNNDWPTATARYEAFLKSYGEIRRKHSLDRHYKPRLVGIFWPSTALVFGKEKGPRFAAALLEQQADLQADLQVAEEIAEIEFIADRLPEEHLERFFELMDQPEIDADQARDLAQMLAPLYGPGEGPDEGPSADDLVETWRLGGFSAVDSEEENSDDGAAGFVDAADGGTGPQAAFLRKLDPRQAVRMFTVWQMKDRAGAVGTFGVGPLLGAVQERAGEAAIHLIGHSYGAMVLLSALVSNQAALASNSISSLLLLQPAVNASAFSDNVAGKGFEGGFRRALGIVRLPIMSTFSRKDIPLTKLFHLAVRRKSDLGEVRRLQMAAGAPSRYAALGGFGPRDLSNTDGKEIEMPAPGQPYNLTLDAPQIYGLRGHHLISGHGDVVSSATAWALFNLVKASRE